MLIRIRWNSSSESGGIIENCIWLMREEIHTGHNEVHISAIKVHLNIRYWLGLFGRLAVISVAPATVDVAAAGCHWQCQALRMSSA